MWNTAGLLAMMLRASLLASLAALSPQGGDEEQVRRLLEIARQAEQAKDYNRSAASYLEILKLRPGWALIHQNLGITRHLQSRYPDAIVSLKQALHLDPQLWGAHLFLGIDYYRTNQFERAIPALEEALALEPARTEAEARFWLGLTCTALERMDRAIEHLRRASELRPGDIETEYALGRAHTRLSSAAFEAILGAVPESAVAHRIRAQWFESEDRLEDAEREYLKALALRPDWEGIHQCLGGVYARQGKPESAARELEVERRLRDAPSGAGPAAGGIALFRKREFAAAAEALEQAAGFDPRDEQVRLYLARCRFELREYDRALRDIEALLARNRDHAEARYWLAMTHLELGSARLERMAAIAPGSYRVHQLNGELQEQKTRYRDALDSYKRALALAPDLAGLRYAVGNVYWKMLQQEEAAEWFKQELARNPDHALSNYRLGSIYVSRQKAGLAIPHLERAIATDPRLVGVHLELGRAFALVRRLDRAVASLNRAAAADPENDAVHSLLARLYQQLGKKAEADAELRLFRDLNQKRLEKVQRDLNRPSGLP